MKLTESIWDVLPDEITACAHVSPVKNSKMVILTGERLDRCVWGMNSTCVSTNRMADLLVDIVGALGLELDRRPSRREVSESCLVALYRMDCEYLLTTADKSQAII